MPQFAYLLIIQDGKIFLYTLRTAKRLNQSGTFISIKFKNKETDQKSAFNNWLVFSIQPKESTYFENKTKIPGLK